MRKTVLPPKSAEWKIIIPGLGLILAAALCLFTMLPPNAGQVREKILIYLFVFLGAGLVGAWAILRWQNPGKTPEDR